MNVFKDVFRGAIRGWEKSSIVLLHLFSKFTSIDRIYKLNKKRTKFLSFFFNRRENPLKDEIYDLQKTVPDSIGQKFKEKLLTYYHENDFMDFTLTFIDGHVIAYFGKKAFQKLKHTTRGKIMKAMEVFNFSDKGGNIFYFIADHDAKGMTANIEKLLDEVGRIIGLDKIKILVFDRGGFSGPLFKMLKDKEKYNLKFITLATQNPNIKKQITEIKKKTKFKKLEYNPEKKYAIGTLKIDNINYRSLLILQSADGEISPFITNMDEEELSDEELLQNYSMHWCQEQKHNDTKKNGSNMHSKALQDIEFADNTKIKRKIKLQNEINKKNNEIIKLVNEMRRLDGKKLQLESKIKPKSKQTDNKLIRKEIKDNENRRKEIDGKIKIFELEITQAEKRIKKIPDNPKKRKYKSGPVDYSISIVNLATNISSKLVEIFSNGREKYQLKTVLSTLYDVEALITEDEQYFNINFQDIRQKQHIKGFERLCDFFNDKNVQLHGKILRFSVEGL